MQFYLDGYKPGDPDILTAELPDAVDVLIVGSGPAGPCWRRNCRLSRASARGSSSVATARSRSVRPTASPAARSRCSRPSV